MLMTCYCILSDGVNVIFSVVGQTDISHASVWPINLQYQSKAAAYRLQVCNDSVYHCSTQLEHLLLLLLLSLS